jgi:hypothetical protein
LNGQIPVRLDAFVASQMDRFGGPDGVEGKNRKGQRKKDWAHTDTPSISDGRDIPLHDTVCGHPEKDRDLVRLFRCSMRHMPW